MIKFGLIGNGTIAHRHKEAIKHIGGQLVWISDPAFDRTSVVGGTIQVAATPDDRMYFDVDYVVICSPTYLHRRQTQEALEWNKLVICEKPLCLPWEPLIDDDRINIVLQLRYIKDLPEKADLVKAVMVRDEQFFKSWKGDPKYAGGNIYEFFIHYIDVAIMLGADFSGTVLSSGIQERKIFTGGSEKIIEDIFIPLYELSKGAEKRIIAGRTILKAWQIGDHEMGPGWIYRLEYEKENAIDIMKLDMQSLYNAMYEDIINGGGIKPRDIFYLTWMLNQYSSKYGYRYSGINEEIFIPNKLM